MKEVKVSIILPVFNAPDDLQRCLDSVQENTPSDTNLLLINDGSSDSRISGIIEDFLNGFPSARKIENPENIGFVKTCNKGFKSTLNDDVILLNSDTVVTKNWVKKLTDAAYSSINVATVTPLTNNGTICSVPTWLAENDIPPGFTVSTFADFIEQISLCRYPTIPTGVGFCMYIKRTALNRTGYFNEVEFDKGYGEENDLCCRAKQAGYSNIIDDQTFVFHAGGKSFGPAKQQIVENNLRKLARLHPTYHRDIAEFIDAKTLANTIDNVSLRLYIEGLSKEKPVCFILHNSIDKPVNNPLGGTEMLCQSIVSDLQAKHPVYVIFPDNKQGLLNLTVYYKQEEKTFVFSCPSLRLQSAQMLTEDLEFRTLFSNLLSVLKPDVIHIHHLVHLPILEVSLAIAQLKIPIIISLHDYYFICPSYNLVDSYGRFCVDYQSEAYCATCIQSQFRQGATLKKDWEKACRSLLKSASLIIVPSSDCADYYRREFPDISDRFEVIPHGIDKDYLNSISKRDTDELEVELPPKPNKDKLIVGFVGSLNKAKGSSEVLEIIQKFWKDPSNRERVFFKVVGELDVPLPRSCRNFAVTGRYARADLPTCVADVDVAVIPSQWPETYCLTADELLALGIPIITTPIGAVPERITSAQAGWVAQSLSSDSIAVAILNCADNPEALEQKKKGASSYRPVSMETVSEQYVATYSRLIESLHNSDEAYSQLNVSDRSFNMTFLSAYYLAQNAAPISDGFTGSQRFPQLDWVKRRNPGLWAAIKNICMRAGLI